VSPGDCALAVGIPISREGFLHDLEHAEDYDFVPDLLRRNKGADHEWVWQTQYAGLAANIARHCDALAALGATVCRQTTLAAFRCLMASGRFKVVALLTHSRWPPIVDGDIPDVGRFLQAVRAGVASGAPVLRELDRVLRKRSSTDMAAGADESNVAQLHQQIVTAVRAAVDEGRLAYEGRAFDGLALPGAARDAEPGALAWLWDMVKALFGNQPGAPVADPPLPHRPRLRGSLLTRALLEHHLPQDVFHHCRCVEFRDGLKTATDFQQAIPWSFAGVLDLTFCNSALHCVVMSNPDRPFLVLASRFALDPDYQMIIQKLVVEELLQSPQPYLAAQEWVRKRILEFR
jgi:hypothetical protein